MFSLDVLDSHPIVFDLTPSEVLKLKEHLDRKYFSDDRVVQGNFSTNFVKNLSCLGFVYPARVLKLQELLLDEKYSLCYYSVLEVQ